MFMQVPISAAKVLLSKGRIPLGLSSGAVRALEQLPMRCFRCFGIGHTRAMCPSVDRSQLCRRCGQAGHKDGGCKAPMKCAVCTASGLSAGHLMGGLKCKPPPKKGKAQAATRPGAAAAEVPPPPTQENGAMSE